jgi:hypothetical protein
VADRRERKNDFSYSVARSGHSPARRPGPAGAAAAAAPAAGRAGAPRRPPAAERLRHDTHPSRKSFLFHTYGIRP